MIKAIFYGVIILISAFSMYKIKLDKGEMFQVLVLMMLFLILLECVLFFEKINNNG